MNKKGEMDNLGAILGVFIVVLVGVILMQSSAQQVGDTVNTVELANATFPATANGTATNIFGRSWSDLVVYNATNDFLINSANYTLANNQVVDGVLTATLTPDASADVAGFAWQLSGTAQPTTYITSSGGRAIANLIVLFFAIAIALVALVPTLRNKILDIKS